MLAPIENLRKSLQETKNTALHRYRRFRLRTRRQPHRVLFLLSHMRSASSLLTHILKDNPEIRGFGESHITYTSEQDFEKLIFRVHHQLNDYRMSEKYILDKVLHNKKIPDISLLQSKNIYGIFLIRDPRQTIPSILALKPHWSQEKAAEYYVDRLANLEALAKQINSRDRCCFFTHAQFLTHTQQVFQLLQDLLEVQKPFTEEYQILKTTGVRGVGDSSANIKAGQILRDYKKPEISVAPALIEQGLAAFDHCQQALTPLCRGIDF